jgi:DNA-binding CsgD family transcriptional regulator
MENKTANNSLYFIKDLHQSGVKLEAIANGARLSPELIKNIFLNKQNSLDEKQFSQLLGFYCYHLCQTQYTQQSSGRLKKFKALFEKKEQAKTSNHFLNILRQRPWLRRKKLILKNISGKESYLTLREQELLYYLLQGKSQIQAASDLNISKRTVEYHWQRMRYRLNISTVNQLSHNWRIDRLL